MPGPLTDREKPDDGALVRRLMRSAWTAALATTDRGDGSPYVSLVAIATAPSGAPLLLVSELAEHTRNLASDPRAGLLFDGTASGPGALTGPRATLTGRMQAATDECSRLRYLARHPGARTYIDFADFKRLRMQIERIQLVAGFGRITRLDPQSVLIATDDASELIAGEAELVQRMNRECAQALHAIAVQHGGNPAVDHWQLSGLDPEGADLVSNGTALRVLFPYRITTPDAAATALIQIASACKSGPSTP
ncbi:MAG: HugZ family protein [Hyphomicrobiaceae bacterium]